LAQKRGFSNSKNSFRWSLFLSNKSHKRFPTKRVPLPSRLEIPK
jgi:hypothetical protein